MVQTVKKKLNPEKTRAEILEAAFNTFAEKGYSGASIADIAEACGAPKSLVLYHHGSKEKLWQDCVRHRAGPMIDAIDRFLQDKGSISDFIKARVEIHQSHPELARMLAWMSVDRVPLPEFITERRQALIERLNKQGKTQNVLLAIAAVDGWFLYRSTYRKLAGDSLVDSISSEVILNRALRMAGEA